jgi:hypothetical protein
LGRSTIGEKHVEDTVTGENFLLHFYEKINDVNRIMRDWGLLQIPVCLKGLVKYLQIFKKVFWHFIVDKSL